MLVGIFLSISAMVWAQALKAIGTSYIEGKSLKSAVALLADRPSKCFDSSASHFKVFLVFIYAGSLKISPMFSSGGMPSSHSSMVTCMASYVAYKDGLSSGSATVAIVMALIVMYDASHVRYEVGKHAAHINRLVHVSSSSSSSLSEDIEAPRKRNDLVDDTTPLVDMQIHSAISIGSAAMAKALEEAVGHTKLEVIAGAAVGLLWFIIWLPVIAL